VDRRLVRRVMAPAAVALCVASVVSWTGAAAAGAATVRAAQGMGVSSRAGAVTGPAVLLVNGDRVMSSGGAGARSVAVAPASAQGLAAGSMSLSLGGHRYVIPTAAVPYLDHGLDWTLFDVSALARAEKVGRLPVRISYGARLRALPGVTITRSGGGLASGYLTTSSARVFGAALIRQFKADRRSGSYGRDGMFAGGESVALAGTTAVAARPDLPMHVLTMTATNISGQPDNGDVVFVVNEDNSTLFGDPVESENDFYKGSTKFSVPAGNYFALGMFFDPSGATRLVVLPHFSVPSTGTTTVPMAESLASSKITFATSLPARVTDVEATLLIQSAAGSESGFGFDNANIPLYLSPTTSAPPVGHLYAGVNVLLHSPSTVPSPYQYNLVYQDASGVIPAQHYIVQASGLATLHERFFQAGKAQGGYSRIAFYPWEGGYFAAIYPQVLPYQRTVYVTADPAALWSTQYWQSYQTLAGGQSASLEQYTAGQTLPSDWNAGPLHAGTDMDLIGAANLFTAVPSASRSGNTLALIVTPFSDSEPGHLGSGFQPGIFGASGRVTGSYEIDQNGKKIASGNAVKAAQGGTALYAQARLSAKPSVIKFAMSASRSGRAYGLATSSRTVWTWPSARQAGTVLPAGWICPATKACVVQPMMTLGYSVPGLGLDESAPPGRQVLDFSATHLQLAPAAAVKDATVQVSQDGGKTWRPVAVTGCGPGKFRAVFSDREAGAVSIRVTAVDSAGSQIKETILSAYKVS
jgi:hypothetical protein